MTTLTVQFVADYIAKRLNVPGGAVSIGMQIPEALKRTAQRAAANPNLRDLFFTNKALVTAPIVAGKVDLVALENTHRILREFLDIGQIYHANYEYPLEHLSQQAGAGCRSFLGANAHFSFYYIEGKFLILPNKETGTLSFAVPSFPKLLSELPNSDEVHTLFFDTLLDMVRGAPKDVTPET